MSASQELVQGSSQAPIANNNDLLLYKIPAGCAGKVKAKHHFTSLDSKCISFNKGDELYILLEDKTGWWNGCLNGKRGWFPSNFVKKIELNSFEKKIVAFGASKGLKTGTMIDIAAMLEEDNSLQSRVSSLSPQSESASASKRSLQRSSSEMLPKIDTSSSFEQLQTMGLVENQSDLALAKEYSNAAFNRASMPSPNLQTVEQIHSGNSAVLRPRASTNPKQPQQREVTRARRPSVSGWTVELSTLINPETEKVTWSILINNILNAISKLNETAKKGDKKMFISQTNIIAQAIRDMLLCAGLIDTESPIFQKHKLLRSHHHNILKSLSKMMLAAKLASGIWPPPDSINKLRFQAGQLLLAIRQFVAAAQETNMELNGDVTLLGNQPDVAAPWQLNKVTEFDKYGATLSDDEFVAKLDQYATENANLIHSILRLLEGPINTEALVPPTRALVSGIGQLLSLIDDIQVDSPEFDIKNKSGAVDAEITGEQRARMHFIETRNVMFNMINEFMSLVQITLEPYAPANSVIQLAETTKELLRCNEALTMATKLVMDQHDLFVQQSLQNTVDLLEEASKRDSDLLQLQRRAMSLTFADADGKVAAVTRIFEMESTDIGDTAKPSHPSISPRNSMLQQSESTTATYSKQKYLKDDYHSRWDATASDPLLYDYSGKFKIVGDFKQEPISTVKYESKLNGPSITASTSTSSLSSNSSSTSSRRKVASVGDIPVQYTGTAYMTKDILGSADSLVRSISSIPEQSGAEAGGPLSNEALRVTYNSSSAFKKRVSPPRNESVSQSKSNAHVTDPNNSGKISVYQKTGTRYIPQQQPQEAGGWDRSATAATNSADILTKMMTSLGEDKMGSLGRRLTSTDSDNPQKERPEQETYLLHNYEPWELSINESGHVLGATRRALVELLTSHENKPDEEFMRSFLYTFRLFMSPSEFVDLLRDRLFLKQPHDPSLITTWKEKKQAPIRLRSWYALKLWIEQYWFEPEDGEVLGKLIILAEDMSKEQVSQASRLHELLEQKFAAVENKSSNTAFGDSSKDANLEKSNASAKSRESAIVATPVHRRRFTGLANPFSASSNTSSNSSINAVSNSGNNGNQQSGFDSVNSGASVSLLSAANSALTAYSPLMSAKELNSINTITDIDANEMARQITLVDWKLFQSIRPAELLRQEWTKKNTTIAVNIVATIRFSTLISEWIIQLILHEGDAKKRAVFLKYFVKLADRLRQIHNYNCVMAVVSALNSAPISRLKRSWDQVSSKYRTIFASMRTFMDHSRNFAVYRQAVKSAGLPCLPFLGLCLTDLVFMNEGNPSERNGGRLLNFEKYRKMTKLAFEDGIGYFQFNYHSSSIYGPNMAPQQVPLFFKMLYTPTEKSNDDNIPCVLVNETPEDAATSNGYHFAPVRQILLFLHNQLVGLTSYSADYLYQLSLEREPREEQISPNSGSHSANPTTPSVTSRGRGHSIISFSSLLHSESSTLPSTSP